MPGYSPGFAHAVIDQFRAGNPFAGLPHSFGIGNRAFIGEVYFFYEIVNL